MSNSDLPVANLYTWIGIALNVAVTVAIVRSLRSASRDPDARWVGNHVMGGVVGALAGISWLLLVDSPFYLRPFRNRRQYEDVFARLDLDVALVWIGVFVAITLVAAYLARRNNSVLYLP